MTLTLDYTNPHTQPNHPGVFNIPCELFVSSMISNFRFDPDLNLDRHLRWLYWSFEGGSENKTDWRDIFACLKILLLARLLRNDAIELLMNLFDIYSTGGTSSRSMPDEEWYHSHLTLIE